MWTFELYRVLTAQRMTQALLETEHSHLAARVGARRHRGADDTRTSVRTERASLSARGDVIVSLLDAAGPGHGRRMLRDSRHGAISIMLAVLLLVSSFLAPAQGRDEGGLSIRIFDIRRATPSMLRVDLGVSGLQQDADLPEVTLQAGLDRTSVQATIAFRMPSRFSMDIDLRKGRVRIGEFSVAEFEPIPPPDENMRLSVAVTVHQGPAEATVRRTMTLPLPTVVVPGYLNDLKGKPDPSILSAFEQREYQATGVSPNLFWFTYRSRDLSLEDAASALARYVSDVVIPSTYAARINVVGYSLGGLLARWNIAFIPGWDRLVNRLILVGVPNEGTVMAYVYAFYPLAGLARTPAARSLLPTFPFWRPAAGAPWAIPTDARNPALAKLNAHPLPQGIRAYAFYGTGKATEAGITGALQEAGIAYGPGDGVVLAASALGLPIQGGAGIPGLAERFVARVDLGSVRHSSVLNAETSKIADALLDRFGDVNAASPEGLPRWRTGSGLQKVSQPLLITSGAPTVLNHQHRLSHFRLPVRSMGWEKMKDSERQNVGPAQ